ncbi:hypothetical protein Purlil1_13475 [Purpureocillium lilacinum]|uniref:Uncharacterized protein n=1 Tax=Purpureocillium lilacinum TaxID=33203 RepID=A0ABR0BDZ5_PURLI|nr:hypothetical protein Purlil1_13475 [Purpureocillium lilacinum]
MHNTQSAAPRAGRTRVEGAPSQGRLLAWKGVNTMTGKRAPCKARTWTGLMWLRRADANRNNTVCRASILIPSYRTSSVMPPVTPPIPGPNTLLDVFAALLAIVLRVLVDRVHTHRRSRTNLRSSSLAGIALSTSRTERIHCSHHVATLILTLVLGALISSTYLKTCAVRNPATSDTFAVPPMPFRCRLFRQSRSNDILQILRPVG